MGLKWLVMTIFFVLFRPESFWKNGRETLREVNAMRDYAAPVIALAQFCKLPFVAVPRMAMLLAVVSFIVDVAVLYLLSGAVGALAGQDSPESTQQDILTVLCYALTPVWLAEPFTFTGQWRWLVMAVAIFHALLSSRFGMQAMLEIETSRLDALSWKSGILLATATMISFVLVSGLARFFTSF
jgi:hypothetical protein